MVQLFGAGRFIENNNHSLQAAMYLGGMGEKNLSGKQLTRIGQ
jgi:hypothetical protein